MVSQNKIFLFKIKRQAKNLFPRDVERTVVCLHMILYALDNIALQASKR